MELHEFHVLERQAGAQHHGVAVAGLGVRSGARRIGPSIAAGRQDGHLRAEAVDAAVVEIERDHAATAAIVIHDQIDGKVFDEELRRVAQRLAVHGMQHGVAGPVGGGAGALRGALAVVGGHAAERPLINLAVLFAARERQAPVLQFVDRLGRVAAQIFDGVLVAEPVRPLHGVVHVPAPIVLAHVAERRGNAALRRHRVRAGREHLGDAGGAQAGFAAADHGAQTRTAGADHHHVVVVILDLVGPAVDGRRCAAAVRSAFCHVTIRTRV